MNRPVVGVCVAVESARYGPWDQDVAMVPERLVTAIAEQGWLALLVTPDDELATEPEEVLRLLDGLIVPDWAVRSRPGAATLADAAESRGMPVVRPDEEPDATVEDYHRAIGGLFTRDARVGPA
ncbi:MAG TPA: hypothetical protein VG295_11080 [Solirubrobacteraceae bacterium]|nr:hypothetical protein [Solirubrobacteraceae bacterium]